MQNRFKSKIFWVGVFSILCLLMGNYGLYDLIAMPEGTFKTVVETGLNLIFGAGGIIGTANDPTNPTGW